MCHDAINRFCSIWQNILYSHTCVLRLPHTSQFFVVELQFFCWGQIRLKFVGPSACRTLADFLSRLTALRLGAESSKIKMVPIPLTWLLWHFLIGWGAREPWQIVLVHRTLANKARQDVLKSSTVRYHLTSPDLVADLSKFMAHWPTSQDFLSIDKKSASVQRTLLEQIVYPFKFSILFITSRRIH